MKLTLPLLTALLLAPLAALHAADPKPAKPNFVVILIDDLGYGDIGPLARRSTARRTSTAWLRKA